MNAESIIIPSVPELPDSTEYGASSGTPNRIIGITMVLVMAVGLVLLAQAWRDATADQIRREASTQTRLLLSLNDTNTGLMEVRSGNGEIFFSSGKACEIFGYEKNELNGRNVSVIIPESFRGQHTERVQATMRSTVSGEVPHKASTMRCYGIKKNGEYVEIIIRIFVSPNGIFALVNRAEDISYFVMPPLSPEPTSNPK